MKVWITKYALTKGVFEADAESSDVSPNMVTVRPKEDESGFYPAYFHGGDGGDWHTTRESAMARAQEMRSAKIASLTKQIKKLKEMSF